MTCSADPWNATRRSSAQVAPSPLGASEGRMEWEPNADMSVRMTVVGTAQPARAGDGLLIAERRREA
jgi:hypothetical protein